MPEVYYFVKTEDVDDILDCGMKLSSFHDKKVMVEGVEKLCFSALLNPKDDMDKYRDINYTCLKLQVLNKYCFAADKFIYDALNCASQSMDLYYSSIIPLEKYTFGTYRLPECLVTTTILQGEAKVLDKRMDSPVIYTNSEQLYINNIIETLREKNEELEDCMLYSLLDRLHELGCVEKIEHQGPNTIFRDARNRIYCIKRPDMDKVCCSL